MSTQLDDKQKQYIDAYTQKTRSELQRDIRPKETWLMRLWENLESLNRKLSYGLLNFLIRNPPLTSKIDVRSLESILVVPYGDAIGDLIVATPIWRIIKKYNPSCRVGVIASYRNATLVQADPDIDKHYFFTGRKDLKHFSELKRARKDKYQVILNLHFSKQTDYGFICNYLGPKAIKATGNHPRGDLYKTFFNHMGYRPRHTAHLTQLSTELLDEIVAFDPPLTLGDSRPSLIIPNNYHQWLIGQLAQLGSTSGKYILINTQGANPFREWGVDHSLSLAKKIVESYPDIDILLTSAPARFSEVEQKVAQAGIKRVHAFKTSYNLMELATLVNNAKLVVTPDTSVAHFATACHTPNIVLFPDPEWIPVEWLSVSTPSRFLAPHASGVSVSSIKVEDVYFLTQEILSGEWSQSQTYFDTTRTQCPMYQAAYDHAPLDNFRDMRLTFYDRK